MPATPPSYFLSDYSTDTFLRSEIVALQKVLTEISGEILKRQSLEHRMLALLEKRELDLGTTLLRLEPLHRHRQEDQPRIASLEQLVVGVERQKVMTRQAAARDVIELKKKLWHYWLLLKGKEAKRYVLR